MAAGDRIRLDELLVERGMAATRNVARALIMAGVVRVQGEVRDKAGTLVKADIPVTIAERPRFVSRAGEKLAHALDTFSLDVTGSHALDVGASTGGFVDCLLQAGAAQVIALDVGHGQLDWRLRNDPRVFSLEKVNARYVTADLLPYSPDLVTMDVSFISVAKVLPAVAACMASTYSGIVLVKPQFEAGPKQVGKGGIVRDPEVHRHVLITLGRFVIEHLDADLLGLTESRPRGTDGNVEFLFHISRGREKGMGIDTLVELVDTALARVPVNKVAGHR